MKRFYINTKRFDIPKNLGGINTLGDVRSWTKSTVQCLDRLANFDFTVFFPESSLIDAVDCAQNITVGCQSVHFDDVGAGKNFGAFTSFRTAKSMTAIGVKSVIIGHSEERAALEYISGSCNGKADVNAILKSKVVCAINAGMKVLYCVGEKIDEQANKYDVIKKQLFEGLSGIDTDSVSVAYEPLWAIGPNRPTPDAIYISDIVAFIKSEIKVPVVYGGGLKKENAEMLAGIKQLDGGLIALTRFGADFGFYAEDVRGIIDEFFKGLVK